MKLYSTADKPISSDTGEVKERPSPYNWVIMLIILLGYMLFTFID